MKKFLLIITMLVTLSRIGFIQAQTAHHFDERLAVFESVLEDMRQNLKIPGMSAALVKDQEVVWV